MNPLIAKEIRLLLPAYGMALLLAILPVWLLPGHGADVITFTLYLFGFGIVMLALSSFGREFAMNTFPLLLAQPLERTRIWWTKIIVLVCALVTVFGALCLSCAIGSFDFMGNSSSIREMLASGALTVVVAFAGALWTTLLLRQVIAAFWFTILIPGAILMIIGLSGGKDEVMVPVMCVYSVAGFWLAWRLFSRSQEVAWTGGVIDLPGWRSANAMARPSVRTRRPIAALFWKELQMHQMGLMAMGALFVLHLGVVWLRKTDHAYIEGTMRTALEVFGGLWYIVPLLTGSLSVSEERKLGMMQELLCLPVSRRVQFFIKLLFTLVLGGLLSALLLWTAEGIGGLIGAGNGFGGSKISFDREALTALSVVFLILAFIGFYASTLTRGIVQALAAAVVTTIVVWLFMMIVIIPQFVPQFVGIRLFYGNLVHYIAWPTLTGTFVWLAWRNFRSVSTDWKLWRRNLLGIAAALVFIVTATTAIYNRAWELIVPSEPAHGAAQLMGPKSVTLKTFGVALTALLSDGRLWVDRVAFDPGRRFLTVVHQEDHSQYETDENPTGFRIGGKWTSISGNQFMPGSNWVDAVTTYRETVAIRADGTLWVSEKPRQRWDTDEDRKLPTADVPASLVRYGDGTDWKSVVLEDNRSVILLKRDGTLWRWGASSYNGNKDWQGLRPLMPRLLSDDSDWDRIINGQQGFYAWKKDGSAWSVHWPEKDAGSQEIPLKQGGLVKTRLPILDNTRWLGFAHYVNSQVGLREDGTLWDWWSNPSGISRKGKPLPITLTQMGTDTNWAGVAGSFGKLAAIKTDGSLWWWNFEDWNGGMGGLFPPHMQSPTRLSRHNDWVAVGYMNGNIISLAADGGLWCWWLGRDLFSPVQPMLAPPRTPSKIENILAKEK